MTRSGVELLENALARYTRQGIPLPVAARWGDIMASYVTGYVLQEQSSPAPVPVDVSAAAPDVQDFFTGGHPSSAETFAASVRTIVLGMRAEAETLAVPRS
jgi:TetR/AcrR family tetracycline transcriptional repressor